MNNALLIAPFSDDLLLREFYNLLAAQLPDFGFALTGINLAPRPIEQHDFPIVSLGGPGQGRRARIAAGMERMLPWTRPDDTLCCYAEMQAQGPDPRAIEREIRALQHFQKRLRLFYRAQKVQLVILNHQFSGYHLIARDVCLRLGIQFFYWHPGFLPGTMSFDRDGQLAESEINQRLRKELNQCGAEEERVGESYRRWAREHSYVRPGKKAVSDATALRQLETVVKKSGKVLLVMGANDYRTGMQPECYPNSQKHSVVIRSSAALFEEAVRCTDESVFVIFKPHPNLAGASMGIEMTSKRSCRVFDIIVRDLLSLTDATVTLCSTAAYEALIFGVATVIGGNLPASDLGICYKVGAENFDLAKVFNAALTVGMQPSMEKRFNLVTGYLLTRYFFATGSGACPLVGRDLRTALSEVLAAPA